VGRWRLAGTAQAQITEILRESEACWGAAAADRYPTLLLTAMQDVADAPDRPGARVFEGGSGSTTSGTAAIGSPIRPAESGGPTMC